MESASKDILYTIAMTLELPDLLRWCASNSRYKESVCNNDNVWRSKLLKDYPEYDKDKFNVDLPSVKETYVFMYQLSYIKNLLNTNESLYDIFLKKTLYLNKKNLTKIPNFNLPNLEELYLTNNSLTEIPSLEKCPSLKKLHLMANKLVNVPSFNLPNLIQLYLSYNQLTKVPLFDLPNLEFFFLDNNQLTEVPSFNLPNLKGLTLDYNRLIEVPSFNLPNLEELDLNDNKLKIIPIFNLPKLEELYLYGNDLSEETEEELKLIYGDKITLEYY